MSMGRVSARRDPSNLIVTMGPDVCNTPVGGCMKPVAYTTIGNMGNAIRYTPTVRNNGKYDFQLNSRVPMTTGHEAGVGRGVVAAGYLGHAHAMVASDFVASYGYATVAHLDPAWVNGVPDIPTEPRQPMEWGKV